MHLAAAGDARYGVIVVDDTGREVAKLTPNGDGPFAVAANGELAFTRSGSLYIWQLRTGELLRSWTLPSSAAPSAVAVSADSRTAVTIAQGGTVTLLSPHGTLTRTVPVGEDLSPGLSMSSNGQWLAVTTSSGIRILDTRHLELVRSEAGIAARFAGSGDRIAIQRSDLSIAIIRTSDWRVQVTAQGEPARAEELSFSPDDRLLAAMGNDGVLRVWDTSDGTLIATRQVIESSLVAQRALAPPVVLTADGFALVGSGFFPRATP